MSKVFEFRFNPLNKEKEVFFDTFCFLPTKRHEKKLGSLYLLGETKEKDLLLGLTETIKQGFFSLGFDEALNRGNNFLYNNPISDLKFAVVSVSPACSLKLSKIGDVRVVLLREKEAFNLSSDLGTSNSKFPTVIEGELQKKDKLLVATEGVFTAFREEKILESLAFVKSPKEVKHIFKGKKQIVKEFSGACLLSFIKKKRIPLTSNLPPSGKLEKGIISFLVLIILLLIGYIFF